MRRTQFVLAALVAAFLPASADAVERELPIHAFGVSASTVLLRVDDDSLAPSLASKAATDEALEAILPYPGTEEAGRLKAEIGKHPELTMGSTSLHFYLVLNHAFDRIFRNIILFDRDNSADAKADGARFANLRTVAGIIPISDARLTLEVLTDRQSFQQRAGAVAPHTEHAFWDPAKGTIVVFFDKTLLRFVQKHASVVGTSDTAAVSRVRDHVARRVIDTLAHQLIHFVQDRAKAGAARNPMLAEMTAVFIQDNIFLREERTRIAEAHRIRGLSLRPWRGECGQLVRFAPSWSLGLIQRLQPAVARFRKRDFSFERLLTMTDAEFHGQDRETLSSVSALLAPFAIFVSSIDKDEFGRRFDAFLGGRGPIDVTGLDVAFERFLAQQAGLGFRDAPDEFRQAMGMTSYCLGERDYASAHAGALTMALFDPSNPFSTIYMGDVFWRMEQPYVALEYYLAADAMPALKDDPDGVRIRSRVGDALQTLGDTEFAKRKYETLKSVDPDKLPIDLAIVTLRSRLKLLVYELAERRGMRPEQISPTIVELYAADGFQGGRCGSQQTAARFREIGDLMRAGREDAVRDLLRSQFADTEKAARDDLTTADWDEVLRKKLEACYGSAPRQ